MCNITRLVLLHAGREAGAADGTYTPTARARKVVRGHLLPRTDFLFLRLDLWGLDDDLRDTFR